MAKRCPACQKVKEETEFSKNRVRKDGLQVQCRSCIKVIQHSWYLKNKEIHTFNTRQRRRVAVDEVIENLLAYFKAHPCVDCGESDPLILEFDHVRGAKRFDIGTKVAQGYNWQSILIEIEKCEVLCVKCHRRKTAKQFGYRKAILMGL